MGDEVSELNLVEDDLGSLQKIEEQPSESPDTSVSSGFLGLLTLDYYQGFFDVTTMQVLDRVLCGMLPTFRVSLIEKLSPTPDLYGPFWIAMTLTFTVALSSNLSTILHTLGNWEFHFHQVTLIATLIFGYSWLVPFMLWVWLWWRGNRSRHTLLQLIAVYGYSLSIFIPLVLLWLINSEVIRWCLLIFSVVLSGCVLSSALWRSLKSEGAKTSTCVLTVVLILHAGLWIGFKFLYFSSLVTSEHHQLSNSTGTLV